MLLLSSLLSLALSQVLPLLLVRVLEETQDMPDSKVNAEAAVTLHW